MARSNVLQFVPLSNFEQEIGYDMPHIDPELVLVNIQHRKVEDVSLCLGIFLAIFAAIHLSGFLLT